MKSIQRPFLSIIDLIVEPWSSKKLPIYNDFFSKLKDDVEKDSILLLTIFFQVPKLSYNSTKILCSKYSLNFREIPDNLPRKLFIDFFTLIQVIASKNSRSYTRVVLICSSSLPKNVLNPFLIEILKYPNHHQVQTVYYTLLTREPNLILSLVENYSAAERALSTVLSSVSLQTNKFPEEFTFRAASLFLSGRIPTSSHLFQAFCFYINRNIFTIEVNHSDLFVLSLFKQIEAIYPRAHSFIYHCIEPTLNYFALPFVAIHLYYNDFNAVQMKYIFSSLVRMKGSVKSFFTLSQLINTKPLKDLYSIAICGMFCQYNIQKKNIHFYKRSLEFISCIHFEIRVLTKVLEIAAFPDFEQLSLEFLKIFKPFTETAKVLSALLKVFFTREKKRIPKVLEKYNGKNSSILTSLYLIGNSPLVATSKLKTRYRSLVKALLPQLNMKNFAIDCIMPKPLTKFLSKKTQTSKNLIDFFNGLTTQQLKPILFDPNVAANMIDMFEITNNDLGHPIRENVLEKPTITDNNDAQNTQLSARDQFYGGNVTVQKSNIGTQTTKPQSTKFNLTASNPLFTLTAESKPINDAITAPSKSVSSASLNQDSKVNLRPESNPPIQETKENAHKIITKQSKELEEMKKQNMKEVTNQSNSNLSGVLSEDENFVEPPKLPKKAIKPSIPKLPQKLGNKVMSIPTKQLISNQVANTSKVKSSQDKNLRLQRPRSMSNIIDKKEESIEISSDGFEMEMPSEEYEYSKHDSIEDYSDDSNGDPSIYNDEMVQMFADMFRPNI